MSLETECSSLSVLLYVLVSPDASCTLVYLQGSRHYYQDHIYYRVFYNALSEIKLKYCQQGLLFGLKMGHVHVPQVGRFDFLRLEWRLNIEDSLHSLQRVKT